MCGWVVDTFLFCWLPRRLVSFFLFWVKERYLRYHPSGFVIRKTMEFYYYGGIRDGIWNCPPEQVGLESLGHSGIQTARIIGTCQASPGPDRIPSVFSTKDRLVEPVCRNLIGCFMYIWWYYVTMIFSSVRCIVSNLQPVYLVTYRVSSSIFASYSSPQFPKRQLRVRAVAFQESYKSFWWSSRTRQCGWCVSFSGYSASV